MFISTVVTHLQALGVPLQLAVAATLLFLFVGWLFKSPMDNFHRWRESKLRDREFLLKIASHPDDDLEAAWINETELQNAFHRQYGIQAGAEERRTYSSLVRRYSPSVTWRHIRGISSLARRSADGVNIELRMPGWERRLRYCASTVGISVYVAGSTLWLDGLQQAVHGSWAEIIVGVPMAMVAAVATRAFLFPLLSYKVIAEAIHGNSELEVVLIPIPERIKAKRVTPDLVVMDAAA